MKKFKLVALCGIVGLFGNIEGFGMDEENGGNKPSITLVNSAGTQNAFTQTQLENKTTIKSGYFVLANVNNIEKQAPFHLGLGSMSQDAPLTINMNKCKGTFSLWVSSNKGDVVLNITASSYSGILKIKDPVKNLTINVDLSSFPCVLEVLSKIQVNQLEEINLLGQGWNIENQSNEIKNLNLPFQNIIKINGHSIA